MSEATIVERLQSQRNQLTDVVRQLDQAISAFGGTISTNGVKKHNGQAKFWATASAAQKAKVTRKRLASRKANRLARVSAPESDGIRESQ